MKVPLGKMPRIDVPFRRVAMDLAEPLEPHTYSKNRYILTFVDMPQDILKQYRYRLLTQNPWRKHYSIFSAVLGYLVKFEQIWNIVYFSCYERSE